MSILQSLPAGSSRNKIEHLAKAMDEYIAENGGDSDGDNGHGGEVFKAEKLEILSLRLPLQCASNLENGKIKLYMNRGRQEMLFYGDFFESEFGELTFDKMPSNVRRVCGRFDIFGLNVDYDSMNESNKVEGTPAFCINDPMGDHIIPIHTSKFADTNFSVSAIGSFPFESDILPNLVFGFYKDEHGFQPAPKDFQPADVTLRGNLVIDYVRYAGGENDGGRHMSWNEDELPNRPY